MKRFGAMLDCSRNAVMKVEEVKRFASTLKTFGYNTLLLYTEDTYEVDGEPYFGYLRGKYTKAEMKEIVSYCDGIGMEVIPCIQTLAHLNQIFLWADYANINDTADILLANEPRTYELIENMFKTLRECYSSEYIHVGMDEAFRLGLGKYLDKYGYTDRFDILNEHLKKVVALAEKYSFKPIMWSDMFFNLANAEGSSKETVPEEVISRIPQQVGLVYWDYYHTEKATYDKMFDAHEKFGKDIWFAGGAWTWMGFASGNKHTLETMIPAMKSAKEHGIDNVFITMWGDNGKECSYYSVLPSLFAVKKVFDGEEDFEIIKKEFKSVTGEDFDHMCALDSPNYVGGNEDCTKNPCKYMFYSDPFYGFLDALAQEGVAEEYECYAQILQKAASESRYAYVFESQAALCRFLSVKYPLGKWTRQAYHSKDRASLQKIIEKYSQAEELLQDFYRKFKNLWFQENKPNGFDVQELRIGGLALRLRSCRERLEEYCSGKITEIPELNEEILPLYVSGRKFENDASLCINLWTTSASVNVL